MARGTTRRGWLILAVCAAAALAVGLPASGAGADRSHPTCDTTSHGLHTGWQRAHDPRRPHWTGSTCTTTVPATTTSEAAVPATPSSRLVQVPAAGTVLTLSAQAAAAPTRPTPHTTTSPREPQRRVEVAPHAATTADESLVLTGAIFVFTLAVSGIVFAAGRRSGRRVG